MADKIQLETAYMLGEESGDASEEGAREEGGAPEGTAELSSESFNTIVDLNKNSTLENVQMENMLFSTSIVMAAAAETTIYYEGIQFLGKTNSSSFFGPGGQLVYTLNSGGELVTNAEFSEEARSELAKHGLIVGFKVLTPEDATAVPLATLMNHAPLLIPLGQESLVQFSVSTSAQGTGSLSVNPHPIASSIVYQNQDTTVADQNIYTQPVATTPSQAASSSTSGDASTSSPAVNTPPTFTNDTVTINQNQPLVLDRSMLEATDTNPSTTPLVYTVNSIVNGYFSFVAQPAVVITSFTQSDINAGNVLLVSNATSVPIINLTATDPEGLFTTVNMNVAFNTPPTVVNDSVTINENQSLTLTNAMLQVTDTNVPATPLVYTVNSIVNGYFAYAAQPTVSITTFAQSEVNAGNVVLISNTSSAPIINVTAADPEGLTVTVNVNVAFNAAPVIVHDAISLNQGQTITLDNTMFLATDDHTPAAQLVYTTTSQNGIFTDSTGTVTTFTQQDINSGNVQFTSTSASAPIISVTVADAQGVTTSASATVTFNGAPVIVHDAISLNQGQTITLDNTMFLVTDDHTPAAQLVYTTTSQNGIFTDSTGTITTFTQQDINNGNIQFTSTSASAPIISVSVADAQGVTTSASATVTFNGAPVIVHDAISLNQGQTITLDNTMFLATDDHTPAAQLVYTTTSQNGIFTDSTGTVTTFTQQDINSGNIQFTSTSASAPIISMTVADAQGVTTSASATVTFNGAPVIVHDAISLNQGQTITLDNTMFLATDDHTPAAQLVYTTTSQNGIFTDSTGTVTTFTQQDINSGNIQFTSTSASAPIISVTVADAQGVTTSASATVTFNGAPVIVHDAISLNQGQTITLDNTMFLATDDHTPAAQLVYTTTSQNGIFTDSTGTVTTFTQQDINNGNIQFTSTSASAPIISVSVADAQGVTTSASATVTFNGAPVIVHDAISLNQGQTITLDNTMFLATDDHTPAAQLVYTTISQNGIFTDSTGTVTTFTQQDINNSNIQFTSTSASAPIISVSVADAQGVTTSASATVTFNGAPVIVHDAISLNQGQTITLDNTMFLATDDHTPAAQLVYTTTSQNGIFTDSTGTVTTFTQQDINSGNIQFTSTSASAPIISMTVADAQGVTTSASATVTFNGAPVIVHDAISLNQGQTITLDNTMFLATDDHTPAAQLVYTTTSQNGIFTDSTGTITTFTQQDINSGNIQFTSTSASAPIISVSVADAQGVTTSASATVTFNGAPVIVHDAISLNQGQTITLDNTMFLATDDHTPAAQLVYTTTSQNGIFTDSTGTVTTFTQQDINSGNIQFTSTSASAPIISMTVADAQGVTTSASATVTFNGAPVIVHDAISLNQGQTITLDNTMFLATDDHTPAAQLVYTTTSQNGIFTDSTGTVTTFTQQDINSGNIQFTSTSASAPIISVTVADAQGVTTSASATVTFNGAPVIVHDAISLNQGQTITLDNTMFLATDDHTPAAQLVYTTTSQNGIFTDSTGTITTFTQQDINNGNIQFTSTSASAPIISVSVADAQGVTTSASATVTFNGAPVIVHDAISLNQGQTITLDNTMFLATDDHTPAAQLVYTTTSQNGIFTDSTGTITTFTQQDINSGNIQFTSTSASAPIISVSVADAQGVTTSASATVTFNGAPVIVHDAISLNQGQTITLDNTMFLATDDHTPAAQLVYTTTSQNGIFTDSTGTVTTFTQQDINSGNIQFTSTSASAPIISVTVADAQGVTTSASATVTFNGAPVIVHDAISLNQGQTITLDNTMFLATDDHTPAAQLVYTTTSQNGIFTDSTGTITTFTQQDINNGNIQFTSTSASAPIISVSVADAQGVTTSASATVTFNGAPVIVHDAISLNQGQTITLDNTMFLATDDHTPAAQLVYTTTSQNGIFTDSTGTITTFTQQDINSGNIQFTSTSASAPIISVSVADAQGVTTSASATVTFNGAPVIVHDAISLNQGQTITLDNTMFLATDDHTPAAQLVYTTTSQNGIFTDSTGTVTTFTQQDINSGNIQFTSTSASAPIISVTVADAQGVTTSASATVTFNGAPVIVHDAISLNQGQTITLDNTMFLATDDHTPAAQLVYTTTSQNGIFTDSTGTVTTFTQQDINSGNIQFTSTSASAPIISVTVADAQGVTTSASATVTFNGAPVIVHDAISLNQGQTITLDNTMFLATDDHTPAAQLVYTTTSQNGIFSDSTGTVTTFTQQDINNSNIQFTSTSASAPIISVTVADAQGVTTSASATVTFNGAPVIVHDAISLNQGQTITLDNTMFLATDDHTPAAQLVYTTTSQNGIFTDSTGTVTTFTQQDINSGNIQFTSTSASAPIISVTVADAQGAVTSASATVTFNAAPVIVHDTVSLNQNQALTLNSSMFLATDDHTPATQLLYTTTLGGIFVNNTGSITSFTQQDINNGNVQILSTSATAPNITFAVTDAQGVTTNASATVIYNPGPTMVNNAISISQNQSLVLTNAMLQATDNSTPSAQIAYTINNIQNGYFENAANLGVPITTFTQQNISDGNILLVSTTASAPNITFFISDTQGANNKILPTVTFNAAPTLVNDSITFTQNQSLVLTSAMLQATDDHTPTGQLAYTVNSIQNGYFENAANLGVPITTFTQQNINDGNILFVSTSTNTPAITLTVADAQGITSTTSVNLTANAAPVFALNGFIFDQSTSHNITSAELKATDDSSSAAQLTYTVTSVQNGFFQYADFFQQISPVTTFTQQNINNGNITLIPTNANPPVVTLTVADAQGAQTTAAINITFNAAPSIVNNTMSIHQGQALLITSAILQATDDTTPSGQLLFIASYQNGYFENATQLGFPISAFTQQDIINGNILFFSINANAPQISINVQDSRGLESTTTSMNVVFSPLNTITIDNNNLTINQGLSTRLTLSNLSATETQSDPLTYTVLSTNGHGYFSYIWDPYTPITSFLAADIANQVVQVTSDGSIFSPTYRLVATDGYYTSSASNNFINYIYTSHPLQIRTDYLPLTQGQPLVLSESNLLATSSFVIDANITWHITQSQFGSFALTSDPSTPITSFTQQDIIDSKVEFIPSGANNIPSFIADVTDTTSAVTGDQLVIVTTSFTGPIGLLNNNLNAAFSSIPAGDTMVLTPNNVYAVDASNALATLTYTVNSSTGGQFLINGNATSSFTQEQINSGDVSYSRALSTATPSFSLSVTDGSHSLGPVNGTVTALTDSPVLVENHLAIGYSPQIITSADILFADANEGPSAIAISITAANHIYFEFVNNPGVAVTGFTQAQINAGQVEAVYDGSSLSPSYLVSGTFLSTPLNSFASGYVNNFTVAPTITNNSVTLYRGVEHLLTTADLNATSSQAPSSLIDFSASNIMYGHFATIYNPNESITSFGLDAVQAGHIVFVPDGSRMAPAYTITASTGNEISSATNVAVTFVTPNAQADHLHPFGALQGSDFVKNFNTLVQGSGSETVTLTQLFDQLGTPAYERATDVNVTTDTSGHPLLTISGLNSSLFSMTFTNQGTDNLVTFHNNVHVVT